MKKTCRLLALAVALMLLCTAMTGCNALDDMRARHGIVSDDHSTITLNNEKYIRLPNNPYFEPTRDDMTVITVTTPEVPLLLAEFTNNDYYYKLNGGEYIVNDNDDYYCPEAKYTSLAARLQAEFNPTGYCYAYTVIDEDTYEFTTHFYMLTEKQIEAVDTVITASEPSEQYSYDERYSSDTVILEACTADGLLREEQYMIVQESGGRYAIILCDEYNPLTYAVPAEYQSTFAAIVAKYQSTREAEEEFFGKTYDEEFYEDEYIDDENLL